ncbi:MAG TPA: hypothetical protein VGD67_05195 [Pseudonocardiaceae bacterium]
MTGPVASSGNRPLLTVGGLLGLAWVCVVLAGNTGFLAAAVVTVVAAMAVAALVYAPGPIVRLVGMLLLVPFLLAAWSGWNGGPVRYGEADDIVGLAGEEAQPVTLGQSLDPFDAGGLPLAVAVVLATAAGLVMLCYGGALALREQLGEGSGPIWLAVVLAVFGATAAAGVVVTGVGSAVWVAAAGAMAVMMCAAVYLAKLPPAVFGAIGLVLGPVVVLAPSFAPDKGLGTLTGDTVVVETTWQGGPLLVLVAGVLLVAAGAILLAGGPQESTSWRPGRERAFQDR